ncbi:MAG: hypothetical protein PHW50_00940 [Patescibacteria group bacterium]|nr:hypothetical protein [Patescibacteria group bacterium]
MKVRVVTRGGQTEVGRGNCITLELMNNDQILKQVMLDCGAGIKIAESFEQGPTFAGLELGKLVVLLTHGHRDHISGIPVKLFSYFNQDNLSIYGSHFTLGMLKLFQKEMTFPQYKFPNGYQRMVNDFYRRNVYLLDTLKSWEYILDQKIIIDDRQWDFMDNQSQLRWAQKWLGVIRETASKCNWHYMPQPDYIETAFDQYYSAHNFDLSGHHSIYQPLGWEVVMNGKRFVTLGDIKSLPKNWKIPWSGEADVLFLDSTGIEDEGISPGEDDFEKVISKLIVDASYSENRRLIIAMFSTNTPRAEALVEMAFKAGKSISFLGRSMMQTMNLMAQIQGFALGKGRLAKKISTKWTDVAYGNDRADVVITTGCQGEIGSGLWKMTNNRNYYFRPGDILVISARMLPGSSEQSLEPMLRQVKKRLGDNIGIIRDQRMIPSPIDNENCADVVGNYGPSGHAYKDDLKNIIDIFLRNNPNVIIVPVHGDRDRREKLGHMAQRMGAKAKLSNDANYFDI